MEQLVFNFVGKVKEDFTNPHVGRYSSTRDFSPANITSASEMGDYPMVAVLDGVTNPASSNGTGLFPSWYMIWDVVQGIENEYGTSVWNGATALSDKITRVKQIVKSATLNYHGYNEFTGGDNIFLAYYDSNANSYEPNRVNRSGSGSISLRSHTFDLSSAIYTDGKIYTIGHGNEATSQSRNLLDYVELVLDIDLSGTEEVRNISVGSGAEILDIQVCVERDIAPVFGWRYMRWTSSGLDQEVNPAMILIYTADFSTITTGVTVTATPPPDATAGDSVQDLLLGTASWWGQGNVVIDIDLGEGRTDLNVFVMSFTYGHYAGTLEVSADGNTWVKASNDVGTGSQATHTYTIPAYPTRDIVRAFVPIESAYTWNGSEWVMFWGEQEGSEPTPTCGWKFFRWSMADWTPILHEMQVLTADNTNLALSQTVTANVSLTAAQASGMVDGNTTTQAIAGGTVNWIQVELAEPTVDASTFVMHGNGWLSGTASVSEDGENWTPMTGGTADTNIQTFNVPPFTG